MGAGSAVLALAMAGFATLVVGVGPAGATTANDETSFRAAFGNAAETSITLTGDITISTCGTPPTRNSSTALSIDGAGFTLTQSCAGVDALDQSGSGVLNISNLTISGGSTGVDSSGPVTLTSSTITGVTNASSSAQAIDSGGDVTLTGSSITNTTSDSGDDVFAVDAGGNVSLTSSSISGTVASGADGSAFAIDCGGDATLSGSTISGTTATTDTGSAFGVDCGGSATLTSSSITGTSGGQEAYGADVGGAVTMTGSSISNTTGSTDSAYAIDNGDATSLTDSQITGTSGAVEGYGIDGGGAVTLVRSTIAGTTAPDFVAAIDNGGTVDVTNSTITGNAGVAIDPGGDVTLVYADIVGNGGTVAPAPTSAHASSDHNVRGPFGPAATGVKAQAATSAQIERGESTLTTFASVIAKPQGVFVNCTPQGAVSEGYNFTDDTSCQLTGTGDQQVVGGDPQLGALAANGGPTLTLLPATSSPLVDGVATAACSSDGASGIVPLTDQRSLPRPQFAGCDIGSVELQPASGPTPAAAITLTPRFTG
jgi:hypothetical protein